YQRLTLQLPKSPLRRHFVRAKVRVHHYPDATLAVFHGPRRLARYAPRRPAPRAHASPCRLTSLARPAPCGHVDDPLRGPAALPPCRCATRGLLAFAHIPTVQPPQQRVVKIAVNSRVTTTGQVNLSSTIGSSAVARHETRRDAGQKHGGAS